MVFSSITFLLFFLPLSIIGYFLVPPRFRNYWLISTSILFYFWGGGIRDSAILIAVAFMDSFFARQIYTSKKPKIWLIVSISTNLGLLCYFKYAAFLFGEPYQYFTGKTFPQIALPLGISFFIFETISYVTDVYRKVQRPARKVTDYMMYLTLFPHLVAGPVYRFQEISGELDPIKRSKTITSESITNGLYLFAFGLAKKCLIANPMAIVADHVYGRSTYSMLEAWIGALAYTFQIFFDFSGYSTMAIGLAMVFGFRFPQNFNEPYCAVSVTDFWRRWHMTLSHWFRDYLYIPLGGNKKGPIATYRNLLIVFLLCGLWHGASWNFVLWGAFHGLFLVIERVGLSPLSRRLPVLIARPLTFVTIVFGWVLFRANTLTQAKDVYASMLGLTHEKTTQAFLITIGESRQFVIVLAFASLTLFSFSKFFKKLNRNENRILALKGVLTAIFIFLSACELASGTFNPFIYFRF